MLGPPERQLAARLAISARTAAFLMLQGGMDLLTLGHAEPLRDRLRGPHQTYIEVPYSTHFVLGSSPLANDPGTTCGGLLVRQFLADPEAPLDTSCTGEVRPLTFTADDDLSLAMFGTTDLWGDDPTAPTPSPEVIAGAKARVSERLPRRPGAGFCTWPHGTRMAPRIRIPARGTCAPRRCAAR